MSIHSDHPALDRDISILRHEMSALQTPAKIEANLLRNFKRQQKPRMQQQLAQWLAPGAAIAASVSMAAWMLLVPVTAPIASNAPLMASMSAQDSPFIALQSLEQIALEPNPRVIETQIPKMLLASMGMPVSPDMAGESLRAEMVVSASGQPLAVRFSAP